MKLIKLFTIISFIILVSFGCAKKDEIESIVQSDIDAPSTPSGLAAQEAGGFINLAWSRNQESDIAKYRLYKSTSTISNSPKANLSPVQKINFAEQGYIEETGTFFADADVITGSTYYYRVSALDRNNNESKKSNQVVITYGDRIAPVKPVGLTALTGSKKGEINLSWTANTESDLLGYKVYKSDSGGNTYTYLATNTANSYTVTGLTPGVQYYFIISAIDTSGNESIYSNVIVSKPNGDVAAPVKPTGLSAGIGTRKGEINLNWTANTESDLLGYKIYKSDSGSSFSFLTSQSQTSYTVTGLIPGNSYFFIITALDNSSNEGEYSDVVFCKAKGDSTAPAIPAGLTVLAGSSAGRVNLSWTANTESDLAKYRVYQSNNGTSYSTIEDIIGQPPDTVYVVNGLTSSTFCYFKITAFDDSDNESSLSARVDIKVP